MKKTMFLNKASAELLSLTLVLPFLTLAFSFVLAMYQYSTTIQELDFATYRACRSAVVCENYNDAMKQATNSASEILKNDAKYNVKIEQVVYNTKNKTYTTKSNIEWLKGNYIKVTVTEYVDTISPFISGNKSRTIIMMIERPA